MKAFRSAARNKACDAALQHTQLLRLLLPFLPPGFLARPSGRAALRAFSFSRSFFASTPPPLCASSFRPRSQRRSGRCGSQSDEGLPGSTVVPPPSLRDAALLGEAAARKKGVYISVYAARKLPFRLVPLGQPPCYARARGNVTKPTIRTGTREESAGKKIRPWSVGRAELVTSAAHYFNERRVNGDQYYHTCKGRTMTRDC